MTQTIEIVNSILVQTIEEEIRYQVKQSLLKQGDYHPWTYEEIADEAIKKVGRQIVQLFYDGGKK